MWIAGCVSANDTRPALVETPIARTNIIFILADNLGYGDTVEELDWSIGELVDALERTGQANETLIIFTSDNGPWFEGSSGASRERKGTAWCARTATILYRERLIGSTIV